MKRLIKCFKLVHFDLRPWRIRNWHVHVLSLSHARQCDKLLFIYILIIFISLYLYYFKFTDRFLVYCTECGTCRNMNILTIIINIRYASCPTDEFSVA